jgi:hypothetical protein
MSVGFLKRLLSFLNIAAVLAIAGTAWGFWSHRGNLEREWQPPDFVIPVGAVTQYTSPIDHVTMRLGEFPEPVAAKPVDEPKPLEEDIQTALDKLGEIRSAIVVYPPYGDGIAPALIFEFRAQPAWAKHKIVTIRMGEALQMRPHSHPKLRAWKELEPARYQFVGCEPDPANPSWTYFLFDMACDGKDIQKARWRGEGEQKVLPSAAAGEASGEFKEIGGGGLIVRADSLPADAPGQPGDKPTETTATQPVQPQPLPPDPGEFRGSLFEEDGGTWAPTRDGMRQLKENYQSILEDARTSPDIDSHTGKARGIRIRAIKPGSMANSFGILQDDVIISINGQKVTSQARAVNVVKAELRKKPTPSFIEVKLLRYGREKSLRFDTRDPDTRRKARDAFRNRR